MDPALSALLGAGLGALITGVTQYVVLSQQRKHELTDRRAEAKRPVYEALLRRVTHLMADFTEDWIEHGQYGGKFREQRERSLADLRLGLLLYGSAAVQKRAAEVEERVRSFFTEQNLKALQAEAGRPGGRP